MHANMNLAMIAEMRIEEMRREAQTARLLRIIQEAEKAAPPITTVPPTGKRRPRPAA